VNLVRSYLSAAFQHGTTSDHDPTRLAREGPIFEVALNPVGQVPRKAEFESVGDRHLSADELRRFWHALDEVDAVPQAFIRFNLCLGGQRAVQLLRATWPAYDFPNSTVLLKDPKGRGGTARDHLVPLTKMALDILEPLRAQNARAAGPFVTRGEQSLHPSTVSKVVTEVWNQLAAEDARSGVQAKHYDRHTYIAEKRRALNKWAQHLTRVIRPKPAEASDSIDARQGGPHSVAATA
jgi:integrase